MKKLGLNVVEFDLKHKSYRAISPDVFYEYHLDKNKIYWIHFDLSDMTDFKKMVTKIDLPEVTEQLCHSQSSISKLIDLDKTLTLKFQCLAVTDFKKDKNERFENIVMHLTDQYCFTASKHPLPALIEFQESYSKALNFAKTSCFILFLILDNAVNDYAKILSSFEILSDELDISIRNKNENLYDKVSKIKQRVMEIKHNTVSIREILMRLSGRKIEVVSEDCRVSLMNLNNHCQMIFNEVESIRDFLNGLLSQVDYVLMYKMNDTMRVLTAFAAIFLPLTLITGIYGMNFQNMPELSWQYGYYAVLLLILFCGLILFYIFKKFEWF